MARRGPRRAGAGQTTPRRRTRQPGGWQRWLALAAIGVMVLILVVTMLPTG